MGGKNLPRPLTSAHPPTTIAIPGLNGGRMGVEVGGEGAGRPGWVVGGRRLGGGSDPTCLQSNDKHIRNNQCKMIVGNMIVCPAGPKNCNY